MYSLFSWFCIFQQIILGKWKCGWWTVKLVINPVGDWIFDTQHFNLYFVTKNYHTFCSEKELGNCFKIVLISLSLVKSLFRLLLLLLWSFVIQSTICIFNTFFILHHFDLISNQRWIFKFITFLIQLKKYINSKFFTEFDKNSTLFCWFHSSMILNINNALVLTDTI